MVPDNSEVIEGISKQTRKTRVRFSVLYAFLILILALLLSRSFYLQVAEGSEFRTTAEDNRVSLIPIPAPRGVIYDSSRTALVENIATTDLVLDPTILPTEEHQGYLLDTLPKLVPNLTPDDISAALAQARQRQRVTLLAKAVEHDTVLAIEENLDQVVGVRLVSSLVRKYPDGAAFSHVIGYTSPVTSEELEENDRLLSIDTTGKNGIERVYDDHLRGEHGFTYTEINASGRPQKDLGDERATPGEDLVLTIDGELQRYVYQLFYDTNEKTIADQGKPTTGAAIAMNPKDGSIKALVSYPGYDPNAFSQPGGGEQVSEFFQAEEKPLFNRATDGTFPPGSVIKPLLALAGLHEGIITEQTTFLSTGGISIGPWRFPDWKGGGHGVTDVRKAIAESVNTYFYILTGGDEERSGLGVERATELLAEFGWGESTGIDLPSEADGFLPSIAWKEEVKGEPWYIGDTYHLGIGQGDVLVTPTQVAKAVSEIANGGYEVTPHLTEQEVGELDKLDFSDYQVEVIRSAMRQTVTDGSGRRLSTLPVALAGKTGTAQIGGGDDTHAWFTSFGPYEDPELVLVVLLERGGAGDVNAVPFAENIWKWWIEHRTDVSLEAPEVPEAQQE